MAADDDRRHMVRALQLARQGEGRVEPNPMVGCVLVRDGSVVGEGWHQQFGGAHAEVGALRAAGDRARGATAYVTLEPCCHQGKTPPCTDALIAAGVGRVVVGTLDPNPVVRGKGIAQLNAAGILVDAEVLADECCELIAPFAKLMTRRRPWIIAKWAMTLDGKLATHTGDSQWISGEESRALVHALRGRVDAVFVGRGTSDVDDPLLTARPTPPGRLTRIATRIVLDSQASLSLESQLVRTAMETPLLVVASPEAPEARCHALRQRGVEVWQASTRDARGRLAELLDELGRREMTNVLVEGGAEVLGSFFDAGEVDEVHAFIGPCIAGGKGPSAVAGEGRQLIADAMRLAHVEIGRSGQDAYVHGRVQR